MGIIRKKLRLKIIYSIFKFTKTYREARKEFYKEEYGITKFRQNYEDEVEFDESYVGWSYRQNCLLKKIRPLLDKHGLEINDEDYMGATAWSLWKDNKKINEFFLCKDFDKTENLYFYIIENYK